jgi:deazaflavin-dependent oxidoreductase (nitroreductase family)
MTSPREQAQDWNRKNIEEFRANGGKVGGGFSGVPLLLLHTVGARSGNERVNPMMYKDLGDGRVAVFASRAGDPSHPDWHHNLVAHPVVTAEIGTETVISEREPHPTMSARPSGPTGSRSTRVLPSTKR